MASPRYTLNIKPEDLQPEQPKHGNDEARKNGKISGSITNGMPIVGIVAALMVFSFPFGESPQVHQVTCHRHPHHDGCAHGRSRAPLAEQLKPYFTRRPQAAAAERSL